MKVDLTQGSDEWLDWRRSRRNASESAVVMGKSPYQSPLQLARIKRGEAEQFVNAAMNRGTRFEPEARAWYEATTGHLGDPQVVAVGDYAASLDWWNQQHRIVTDFKVPASADSELWKLASQGVCPEHYAIQLQHQAHLMHADTLHLAVYMPELKAGYIIEVVRDKTVWDAIQAAWDAFWTDYMLPETIDTERDDQAWRDATLIYLKAKERAALAERDLNEAKAELITLAGKQSAKGCGIQVVRSEGKTTVKWAEVAKACNAPPELVAKYSSTSQQPSFTVKECK